MLKEMFTVTDVVVSSSISLAFCHLMKIFQFQMYTMIFTTNEEI